MIMRIWAWLTGGELVYLRDFDGEVSESIAYTNAWGEKSAYRYWATKIHHVCLLPDGTVQQPNYVKEWRPME